MEEIMSEVRPKFLINGNVVPNYSEWQALYDNAIYYRCEECGMEYLKNIAGCPNCDWERDKSDCDICSGRELNMEPGGIIRVCKEHFNWQPPVEARDIWDLI